MANTAPKYVLSARLTPPEQVAPIEQWVEFALGAPSEPDKAALLARLKPFFCSAIKDSQLPSADALVSGCFLNDFQGEKILSCSEISLKQMLRHQRTVIGVWDKNTPLPQSNDRGQDFAIWLSPDTEFSQLPTHSSYDAKQQTEHQALYQSLLSVYHWALLHQRVVVVKLPKSYFGLRAKLIPWLIWVLNALPGSLQHKANIVVSTEQPKAWIKQGINLLFLDENVDTRDLFAAEQALILNHQGKVSCIDSHSVMPINPLYTQYTQVVWQRMSQAPHSLVAFSRRMSQQTLALTVKAPTAQAPTENQSTANTTTTDEVMGVLNAIYNLAAVLDSSSSQETKNHFLKHYLLKPEFWNNHLDYDKVITRSDWQQFDSAELLTFIFMIDLPKPAQKLQIALIRAKLDYQTSDIATQLDAWSKKLSLKILKHLSIIVDNSQIISAKASAKLSQRIALPDLYKCSHQVWAILVQQEIKAGVFSRRINNSDAALLLEKKQIILLMAKAYIAGLIQKSDHDQLLKQLSAKQHSDILITYLQENIIPDSVRAFHIDVFMDTMPQLEIQSLLRLGHYLPLTEACFGKFYQSLDQKLVANQDSSIDEIIRQGWWYFWRYHTQLNHPELLSKAAFRWLLFMNNQIPTLEAWHQAVADLNLPSKQWSLWMSEKPIGKPFWPIIPGFISQQRMNLAKKMHHLSDLALAYQHDNAPEDQWLKWHTQWPKGTLDALTGKSTGVHSLEQLDVIYRHSGRLAPSLSRELYLCIANQMLEQAEPAFQLAKKYAIFKDPVFYPLLLLALAKQSDQNLELIDRIYRNIDHQALLQARKILKKNNSYLVEKSHAFNEPKIKALLNPLSIESIKNSIQKLAQNNGSSEMLYSSEPAIWGITWEHWCLQAIFQNDQTIPVQDKFFHNNQLLVSHDLIDPRTLFFYYQLKPHTMSVHQLFLKWIELRIKHKDPSLTELKSWITHFETIKNWPDINDALLTSLIRELLIQYNQLDALRAFNQWYNRRTN